jgi:hypothetical protein
VYCRKGGRKAVPLIVQLKTAVLDYGIPGVSPAHMLVLFGVAFAVPMIPFLFLYFSVRGEKDSAPAAPKNSGAKAAGKPFETGEPFKMVAPLHVQRNPEPLHH